MYEFTIYHDVEWIQSSYINTPKYFIEPFQTIMIELYYTFKK